MTEQEARALAATLGGEATGPMPSSRAWGVLVTRADGRLAAIEDHAGWLYRDRQAYDGYHRTGDPEPLDAREWSDWGINELWASSLAALLGAEAHQSGGNIWVVLYPRPDGRAGPVDAGPRRAVPRGRP